MIHSGAMIVNLIFAGVNSRTGHFKCIHISYAENLKSK